MTAITYRDDRDLPLDPLVALYRANAWSSAEKGEALREAMRGSHSVVTAWAEDRLVGLGNTLSDGHLVVYYPHLLVHPDFRRRGIGAEILRRLRRRYEALHMHILVADGRRGRVLREMRLRAGRRDAGDVDLRRGRALRPLDSVAGCQDAGKQHQLAPGSRRAPAGRPPR